MCKRLLTVFAVAWGTLSLSAGPRSAAEAQQLAAAFFEKYAVKARGAAETGEVALAATSADLSTVSRTVRQASAPAYYVYNQADNGFVIISGDDRMPEVLGYSFGGEFALSEVPDNMRAWLQRYELKQDELDTPGAVAASQSVPTASEDLAPSVEPLLGDIKFNQTDPYNRMCPTVSGKRCYTGCVATAMAQIMRYYGYPEKGTLSKSYTTQTHGLQLSFDFGQTTFDWDNILPAYTSGQFNTAEADAVAELMFACGVAASMDYDPAWASSSLIYAFTGVTSYFGYNPYTYIAHDFNYSLEGWTDLLKSEINARRPVIFTASDAAFNAHAFVLDGYDEEGLFHVNWGWGGTNDGYYLVTRLDPGVTSAGEGGNSGYQFEQTILVGLLPKSDTVKVQSHFEAECLKVDTVNRTARIERIYNRSSLFSGRMAIIAELDDVQQVISDEVVRTDVGFGSGFGWVDFTLNIPSGLSDGVYDVYMGTKPDNGTRWDQVVTRYGLSPDYALVVDGGVARIVEDDDATLKPEVKVIPAGELHSNRAEIFMIAIKNPRQHHEFAGWIDLTLLDNEQYYLYNERIEQVYLEPGEADTIRCVMNMPEYEGKAYICASWFYDSESHYVSEPLEVTIGAQGQRATTVRAIRCKLANSRVETHTDVVCTGQLGISGAGDYFDGALVASLYRNNSSSAAVQTQRIPVSLQKGEVQDFTVKLNADVTPGSYSFRLYSYDATKSSPLTQLWTSSVFVTVAVGIPSVEAESQLQAAVDKGASVVRLTSDQPLRSVRLYSAGGAQLRQATFQGDERAYSLNVAGLPSGTYVVQVALADGTTQQVKFVR